ncbi:hypothetical protein RJ639_025200 [Escallonia herrerae]|uniref:Uncharacterized protein n=1 Tax=Escallonia herrerae TaxID=1293975 RepID=A0AA88SCT9_9ASTE|nr:hypothetical protein RJ639_025200 [Escallonia herrerae]
MTWLSSALRSSTKKRTIQVLLPGLSPLRSEELFTSWAGVPKETDNHRKSALSPSRSLGHGQVYRRQCCFTSTVKQGTSSIVHRSLSSSTEARAPKKAEVEVISKENIKPASLTHLHLRKYKLSGLDQLFNHLYAPLVFYYPNSENVASENVIHERSQRLKQSLSETLTRFYPFAGRIKDELHIECNDDRVYYVQTRVKDRPSDFLSQPDNKLIHKLLPYDPNSMSSNSETYLVMIQVNFFDCGGVAISLCTSHKLIDGHTYAVFLKAWTETARGSSEKIYPSFIAPSLFPPNPSLAKGSSIIMLPSKHKISKCVTRRICFNASAISALKEKAEAAIQNPSRAVTVASLSGNAPQLLPEQKAVR